MQFVIALQHLFDALTAIMERRRQAHVAEHGEHLELRCKRHPFDLSERIKKGFERAFRRRRRVKLAQRPGGGIARIREQRFAGLLALFVQFSEIGLVHIDFAAHFEPRRKWKGGFAIGVEFLREAQRNCFHGFQILRHVFSGHAVAARRAGNKNTVFVNRFER